MYTNDPLEITTLQTKTKGLMYTKGLIKYPTNMQQYFVNSMALLVPISTSLLLGFVHKARKQRCIQARKRESRYMTIYYDRMRLCVCVLPRVDILR